MLRRAAVALFLIVPLAPAIPAAVSQPTAVAAPAARPGAGLAKEDRALIAEALAEGRSQVSLLVASAAGANPQVADRARGMGAAVAYRDDDVGYLRLRVAPRRAAAVAAIAGVAAVAVDQQVEQPEPELPPSPNTAAAQPPDAQTPPNNPYLPTRDIGAPQFVQANPTYDGRGVTVGIVEFDGVDLFTQELQTARQLDGTPTRKVVDYVVTTDPDNPFAPDPTWVDMTAQVGSVDGKVTFQGQTYSTPADGTFRIGLFNERKVTFSSLGGDVNRDGNPATSSGDFAVLWDASANDVWVDADQNASFADEPAMTDYRVDGDVGTFGQDDPGTAVRETVPFVVQTDGTRKLVNVSPATGDHGTGVASAAVGKDFFGGTLDGSAPEARLAVARSSGFTSSTLEGVLHLAMRSHVDLISLSFGPANVPSFNPSVTVYSVLFDRLTQQFGVQIFASAGNSGNALESVASPSTTRRAISVGASGTGETTEALVGFHFDKETMFSFSSRGPADDGALKPDIVAPGLMLVANPAWQEGFTFPSAGYELPPGYATYAGTSFSSPMAAGGAALLLSAARQTDVPAQPDQLRQAIFSAPRRLPDPGFQDQGRGVLDVGAAWQVLRQKLAPVEITIQAPVRHANSARLTPAHTGPGLYERDGWAVGDQRTRTITLTRQTGKGTPVKYNLSWIGNDGTFTAPSSVTLPRRTATGVQVGIAVATPGIHSAILNVDDPSTPGIDHQVPFAVAASEGFNDANEFTVRVEGEFEGSSGDVVRAFLRLPGAPVADVLALRIKAVDAANPVFVNVANPFGQPRLIGTQLAAGDETAVRWPVVGAGGTWELVVEGSSAFALDVSIIGAVDVSPSEVVIDPATVGAAHDFGLDFTASAIGFTGQAVGSDLGPLRTDRPPLTHQGEPAVYEVDVPAGASAIAARIDHASDPGSDLDLYLFDCASFAPFCELVADGTSPTATEQVVVRSPAAGEWVVVVDPFDIPSGSGEVDYSDVAAAPSFGSITVDDPVAFHPANSTWSRDASVTPLVSPPGGRLGGFISVVSGNDFLWGGALVDLRNVTG